MTPTRDDQRLFMRRASSCALFALMIACSALYADSPATVNNDDSCDIIVAPAATLLLPYFEVDLKRAGGETTLFTITNVTQRPQIAYVTVWTDWSFPVFAFRIFLGGYDVQSINLYDLLALGRLSGRDGTTSDSAAGERSLDNDENPLLDISDCDNLAIVIPPSSLRRIQDVFTTGRDDSRLGQCPNRPVGGAHDRAIGYLTIDVVESCSSWTLPTEAGYFTSEILYDNVLTGDYQQVSSHENRAQGGPMVHIRAIPEGGRPGAHPTNFTTTFYSNLQYGGTADRRQPLPATFAARWISAPNGELKTRFKIWREGVTRGDPRCAVVSNSSLSVADIVRFDEDENPVAFSDCETCDVLAHPLLPATSNRSSEDNVFPPNPDGATAGWMYMNLNNQGVFPFRPFQVASQNWVTVSMEAGGLHHVELDAASLGNGCTPSISQTEDDGEATVIAPAVNAIQPAFASGAPATVNNDDSCDIKVTPAATLLLPYFEVDLVDANGETTLFTITNVAPLPQIARVTIWTEWAFPVLTFNVFLTGYDVQSINLRDVLDHGRIAEPGTSSDAEVGRRSEGNDANVRLETADCGKLPDRLPPQILGNLRNALSLGRTTACPNTRVGSIHGAAIGYATIDVVRNCSSVSPVDAGYFSTEILYDNVLIGDYQQVNPSQSSARGNTLVHIRAIPEGGSSGSAQTSLRRTFYSRLQNGGTADRRQPLPSTFAARWIFERESKSVTTLKIWREGVTDAAAGCAVHENAEIRVPDIVRFDEDENPEALETCDFIITVPAYCYDGSAHTLPTLSQVIVNNDVIVFPPNPHGANAGWMYLNLDNYPSAGAPSDDIAAQSWVVVSMAVEGRYSIEYDATSLGNGCSPPALITDEDGNAPAIGPAANTNPGATPNP